MPVDRHSRRSNILESGLRDIRLESGGTPKEREASRADNLSKASPRTDTSSPKDIKMRSNSQSPVKNGHVSGTLTPNDEDHKERVGGDITLKVEPGQPPKLSRSNSQKITARSPMMFNDHADKTEEARKHFEMIPLCSYANKYLGATEHQYMDCDCVEEWDSIARANAACGDDSDCINRMTKLECVGDCGCGPACQNQRFQRKQFAKVSVIQTEKKGYGLRADRDLNPDDFIYEYIGEVIGEAAFRNRMRQYDEERIKHFYFMSLSQGEFVDATKKGNLGRFCNHSCNPNCYVDKWVVGEKLRMGIFAERKVKAGEELTFNYNVDRYGADPQVCYCGEPNCTGYIGGKTQTERATKLSHTTIEALGIDDGDGWDIAVAKKPRKKKSGEDDEEYVNDVQPKSLDEHGVTKVMATLMQCKEKWIAVKLLSRIQRCDDERVRNRVVKMHGYQILNSNLALWKEDANVVLQIFDILDKFPRLTRNKISDSKIEVTVTDLKNSDDEKVASKADHLLQEWANLEVAYRIPRMKREVDATATPQKGSRYSRRDSRDERIPRSRSNSREGSRSSSRSVDAPRGPAAPSGPRNNFPQRQPGFYAGPRPPFRPRPFNTLPTGWFSALDEGGRTYYYDMTGKTTWERPTAASAPPPPPPKPTSTNKALEDIINEITNAKANTPKEKPPITSSKQAINGEVKKIGGSGKEKWRSLPVEKQMKLYENTLFPHVKYVMDRFKGKLPKDDLKRFAKEISKKLVSSDFKNHRVEDPTKIDSKKEKQIKTYVKDYFDKAAKKHKEREQRRAERKAEQTSTNASSATKVPAKTKKEDEESDGDQDMAVSDDEDLKTKLEASTPITPMDQMSAVDGLKRKREDLEGYDSMKLEDLESTPNKMIKSETPPPPPPPPPAPSEEVLQSPASCHLGMTGMTGMEEESFAYHSNNTPMYSADSPADVLMSIAEAPPPPPPPIPPASVECDTKESPIDKP